MVLSRVRVPSATLCAAPFGPVQSAALDTQTRKRTYFCLRCVISGCSVQHKDYGTEGVNHNREIVGLEQMF